VSRYPNDAVLAVLDMKLDKDDGTRAERRLDDFTLDIEVLHLVFATKCIMLDQGILLLPK
jgi:hypothetical protein